LVIHAFELLPSSKHILKGSAEHESIETIMDKVLKLFGEEEEDTVENRFRQLVDEQFIQDRKIALDSLMEGLTLYGKCTR
jgi:hypothetical protein